MTTFDHKYKGVAYPVHWGGYVEKDNPVELDGRFRSEDYQDGIGILLWNYDREDLMGWVVRRQDWPKVKYDPEVS